jgi:hypothetical protein
MLRHTCHRLSGVVIAAAAFAACDDVATHPRDALDSSFAILDGARGGTAHFFFLPPMVPAPSYSGTFDGTQSPRSTAARCRSASASRPRLRRSALT